MLMAYVTPATDMKKLKKMCVTYILHDSGRIPCMPIQRCSNKSVMGVWKCVIGITLDKYLTMNTFYK